MERDQFSGYLLKILAAKRHWAQPAFAEGLVPRASLHHHFEHEMAVNVRPLGTFLRRAWELCPDAALKARLIEHRFKERDGRLTETRPFAKAWLEVPRGLGMAMARFEDVPLGPAARRYAEFLDDHSRRHGWAIAAATTCLLVESDVEGGFDDRAIVTGQAPAPRPAPAEHPWVRHYGLPLASLAAAEEHRALADERRAALWPVLLDAIQGPRRDEVVKVLGASVAYWQAYRDEVAAACGLAKTASGRPVLAAVANSPR